MPSTRHDLYQEQHNHEIKPIISHCAKGGINEGGGALNYEILYAVTSVKVGYIPHRMIVTEAPDKRV